MSECTRAEVCAVALAEVFRGDGEILASPIGNLPSLGALDFRQAENSPSRFVPVEPYRRRQGELM